MTTDATRRLHIFVIPEYFCDFYFIYFFEYFDDFQLYVLKRFFS